MCIASLSCIKRIIGSIGSGEPKSPAHGGDSAFAASVSSVSSVAWLLHDASTARKIELIGPTPQKRIKMLLDVRDVSENFSTVKTCANIRKPYRTMFILVILDVP